MCWTPLCANIQTYTNNVNKTYAFLQINGSKDEPNIVCTRISKRTSQHGTQNAKTHNRTRRKTKKMRNTNPQKRPQNNRSCQLTDTTVREQTCGSTQTNYSDSEPTSLCSFSLVLRAKHTNFIVFGLTRLGLEPTSYRT